MSYTLLLLRVPPGAAEEEIERIARSAEEIDRAYGVGPPDPDSDRRKQALVDALLTGCPELRGGEPDYAALARAEKISEEQARERHRWWTLTGPEEGAGIEITLYDDHVSVDLPSAAGTDEDWQDVWRYLEILVREGGFAVWDPQGGDLVNLESGPFGDRPRKTRRDAVKPRRTSKGDKFDEREQDDGEPGDVEPEDARRGGEIAALINQITDEAIAEPLKEAGFKRSGRTWRRVLDNGLVHVASVQWSPRNGGVEGVFSLTAGVYSRELAESIALFKPTNAPKEPDCQVRLRPGPHGRRNWQVRLPGRTEPDPDLPGFIGRVFTWLDRRADNKAPDQHVKATRELRETLEQHAFPAFERLTTLRGVRDHLANSPDLFWAAHASLLLGERDEARQLLDRALKKASSNPEFAENIRAWGLREKLL